MLDVVVVTLGSPVLIGVYKDGNLVESFTKEGMGSDVLPIVFEDLLSRYKINRLIYAKGPGSFMGIKVAYLFLKTLSIVKMIPLLAIDGFFFNQNSPIKAVGKLYFVKNSSKINLEPLVSPEVISFSLPKQILVDQFEIDALPAYGIDAV